MTHVSKKKLKESVQKEITSQLTRTLFTAQGGGKLFHELLTDAERVMLAKRIAILFMLEEEFSYYRIASTLKVSTSTIKRLHQQLLGGDHGTLQSFVKKKEERARFSKTIELVLRAGLPPMGKGRWRTINKLLERSGRA